MAIHIRRRERDLAEQNPALVGEISLNALIVIQLLSGVISGFGYG
jgi:hypothetical protein